jgi:hypothetical protein
VVSIERENKSAWSSKQAHNQLKRLTAELAALADWKEDIQRRLEHAIELQDRGVLFPIEQDVLSDEVRAWRLAAAHAVLDLASEDDMRRVA